LRAAALAATLTLTAAQARAQVSPPSDLPIVTAGTRATAIRLDGMLDEPAWQQAGVITDLTQQSPRPGEPTPFHTEVRILADGGNLYFGVTCTDPDPARIAVHTMQRDGNMLGDDTISIVLDTFHDHRTGYLFEVNAAGARLDGLISDPNAEGPSLDWDGIWDVAARRTATGWTAEIVLPAQTIRFNRSTGQWGFNIQRYVAREQLTLRWAGTTLDANLLDMRRAGNLAGVGGLDQGWGLTVSPYVLGRYESDLLADHSFTQGQAGVDVGYHVTSQVDGVLTVNPDFAEVEADSRQVNLTRFALFFPEKRPFFTDGANFFDFGLDLQADFIPFYSRTVGLFNDRIIPITAGLKVVGREGPWGVGFLDVQTRDAFGVPGTNLAAGRVTYDVNQNLRVGAIGTNGNPNGRTSNSLAGVDAVWQTASFHGDKNLGFGVWATRSFGEVGSGDRNGWGVKAQYPNDLWNIQGAFKQFGDALDPVLGYLPRPGTRQYSSYVAYQPRPSGGLFSGVRQFFFELNPVLITDLHQRTESFRVFMAPINLQTQAGDHYEANYAPEYQRLTEPFEIAPGVVIPTGSYQFHRFRVQIESSDSRPLSAGGTVWFGGFYDGHLTQVQGFVKWTEHSGHLQVALNLENDYGYLPEGNFIFRLWQLKTVYAFNPNLLLATFFQYDSESQDLGLNARLRWTIQPGRDLFIVWNRGWKHPISDGGPYFLSPEADQLILKLRWTFTR
jgi:Domain of unknown function (DUF5916)/Carbohydrate family 9 binding domain-like